MDLSDGLQLALSVVAAVGASGLVVYRWRHRDGEPIDPDRLFFVDLVLLLATLEMVFDSLNDIFTAEETIRLVAIGLRGALLIGVLALALSRARQ
jgi:protein-S-isoprenylcysteine O-methyltransferase Ste14